MSQKELWAWWLALALAWTALWMQALAVGIDWSKASFFSGAPRVIGRDRLARWTDGTGLMLLRMEVVRTEGPNIGARYICTPPPDKLDVARDCRQLDRNP